MHLGSFDECPNRVYTLALQEHYHQAMRDKFFVLAIMDVSVIVLIRVQKRHRR